MKGTKSNHQGYLQTSSVSSQKGTLEVMSPASDLHMDRTDSGKGSVHSESHSPFGVWLCVKMQSPSQLPGCDEQRQTG